MAAKWYRYGQGSLSHLHIVRYRVAIYRFDYKNWEEHRGLGKGKG